MNAHDLSNEILNEMELEKVVQFSKDPLMFSAVKKYILAVALKHGTMEKGKEFKGNVNFALGLAWGATEANGMPRSDEELGQALRALTYAVKLVESGFKELAEMEVPEALPEETKNPTE